MECAAQRRTLERGMAAMLVLTGLGCGPDEIAEAEHDEICGEPGPFRLLELDDDEPLSHVHQLAFVEDRRVLQIGYLDVDARDDWPRSSRIETWSVGACGEAPLRLEEGLVGHQSYAAWPDVVLGCRPESGEVVTVDPHGARPRNVVFRMPGCRGETTPWGIVAIEPHDEETGALVLQRYPEDPWTQTAVRQVLLDPVRIRGLSPYRGPTYHEILAVFPDELFVVTANHELVHISLLDGSLTTQAIDVGEFEVSPDRRYVVSQDLAPTATEDPDWPEGRVNLLDRTTRTTTHLADTALAFTIHSAFTFMEDGFVKLHLGGIASAPQRFFDVASGGSFDLPPGSWADWRMEDGRWLTMGPYGVGPFGLLDPATRSWQALFSDEGSLDIRDGSIFVLEGVACCITQNQRSEGRLWSVAANGERELLAWRATLFYRFLADDSVVSVVDVNSRWHGNLLVVEPDTLDERRVDADVTQTAWVLDDGETMLYGVSDRDRTGVWLARLTDED